MKIKLKNNSDEAFNIGNKIINPGRDMTFQVGGISFEAGYAFKFLTFSVPEEGGSGGIIIGVQAGTYLFAGLEDWHEKSSEDMISGFSKGYSFSPYLRITIGGGGFTLSDEE